MISAPLAGGLAARIVWLTLTVSSNTGGIPDNGQAEVIIRSSQ